MYFQTEKNTPLHFYRQIDKEALSLVYGIQKFHQYFYDHKFVLVTDHKPLITLFGPKKGIPSLVAARLQRWALLLSAYSYILKTIPMQMHYPGYPYVFCHYRFD